MMLEVGCSFVLLANFPNQPLFWFKIFFRKLGQTASVEPLNGFLAYL